MPFHTLVTNLEQEPDTLLAKIKKGTRYEIRRASEKDKLTSRSHDSVDTKNLSRFLDFYSPFATANGIRPANRLRLQLLAETGALYLSEAENVDGATLVWHAYGRFQNRARLLYSASTLRAADDRGLIGRANRYLHWQDFLALRTLGAKLYDFGGWHDGVRDTKKIGINQFKAEFGGEMVVNFNHVRGATWKGKAGLWVSQHLARMRHD